jgi:hypothetical protein
VKTKLTIQIRLIFNMKRKAIIVCLFSVILASCKAIKPYERVYIDDQEMELSKSSAKNFDAYIRSIREGAVPSSGSKSSGGCGCN